MEIEKAIEIIEGMEQMQCCCEVCEMHKPALEIAIKALKKEMTNSYLTQDDSNNNLESLNRYN